MDHQGCLKIIIQKKGVKVIYLYFITSQNLTVLCTFEENSPNRIFGGGEIKHQVDGCTPVSNYFLPFLDNLQCFTRYNLNILILENICDLGTFKI
jgi:hypothetical protein